MPVFMVEEFLDNNFFFDTYDDLRVLAYLQLVHFLLLWRAQSQY